MGDIACPVCRKSNRAKVLSLASQATMEVGARSCGNCYHTWRTEPWKTSDAIKFFRDDSELSNCLIRNC